MYNVKDRYFTVGVKAKLARAFDSCSANCLFFLNFAPKHSRDPWLLTRSHVSEFRYESSNNGRTS